jgi:SAM-dependent methyltransferase
MRLASLARGLAIADLPALRLRPFRCPLCGPSVLVRLAAGETAVRCVRCTATPIAMSLASVLQDAVPDLAGRRVYELSARGALVAYLRRGAGTLVTSEFVEGAAPGSAVDGVRVEDVQRLTFADATFDVCTSTEVLEHVPDDARGFAELRRVLAPGGTLAFTVPLVPSRPTVERARLEQGVLRHLEPPEYHADPARGARPILAFRTYGGDIVDRLLAAGFARAAIVMPRAGPWFGHARPVVVAVR